MVPVICMRCGEKQSLQDSISLIDYNTCPRCHCRGSLFVDADEIEDDAQENVEDTDGVT